MIDSALIPNKLDTAFGKRANEQYFSEFGKSLQAILMVVPERCARTEEFGAPMDFSTAVPFIQAAQEICTDLVNTELFRVPSQTINELNQGAKDIAQGIQRIHNTRPGTNNLSQNRTSYIQEIENGLHKLTKAAPAAFQVNKGSESPFDRLQEHASKRIQEIDKRWKEFDDQLKEANTKIALAETNLNKSRELARDTAVQKYATYFQDEAKSNNRQAWAWLIATAGFAATTAWYGIHSSNTILSKIETNPNLPTHAVYAFVFARIALFSVMLTATLWCGRTFKSLKHNYVVNKHRENAFNSFAAFVAAAGSDQQTKNAVLLEATQSIFAPQSSGFSDPNKDAQQKPTIMEFVKNIPAGK